jgi:hypothetical protein
VVLRSLICAPAIDHDCRPPARLPRHTSRGFGWLAIHCFAKRLRDMGIKMFIYPNVDIVHWGYKDFSGNYDKWLKGSFNKDTNSINKQISQGNEPGKRLAA